MQANFELLPKSPDAPLQLGQDFDQIAEILLPLPLDAPFSYRIPAQMVLKVGDFVEVPFGPHQKCGVVWTLPQRSARESNYKLKTIHRLLPAPPLPKSLLSLVAWVSSYYLAPLGAVLRAAMHEPALRERLAKRTLYRWAIDAGQSGIAPAKLSPQRQKLYDALQQHSPLPRADILAQSGVSAAVFKAALDKGLLQVAAEQEILPALVPDPLHSQPQLREDQHQALSAIRKTATEGFTPLLLDGVTGAGKTFVYMELLADIIQQGRSGLVLLPEIALSNQWLSQFRQRFGVLPAVWHSGLTPQVRRQTWRAVAEGKVQILVGARSALFLPFPNLGLIVVDEEHEAAFKQDDGLRYHARDVAVMRAKLENCPILLSSATPSLESQVNVKRGRYQRVSLEQRHSEARQTQILLVDMRRTPPPKGSWIAPPLDQALQDTLAQGEQALIFLNRRGYAPLTLCRSCGYRLTCDFCSAWLVHHRFRQTLACHHCGHGKPLPPTCPECQAEDSLVPCGPGVERVLEELQARFPDKAVEMVSSDTLHTPEQIDAFIGRMTAGEIDVLVGTQIVAKGYNFPGLTLVGLIDADLGLNGGDPRASERSFQLITQVAGRAGRYEKPGRVLLQTYEPSHPVLQALAQGDRERFYEAEIEQRSLANLPPFGRLAIVLLSDPNEHNLQTTCQALFDRIPKDADMSVLGPAPAPISMVRGRYRYRFIVKCGPQQRPQSLLLRWLGSFKLPSSTRMAIDIDPISFM